MAITKTENIMFAKVSGELAKVMQEKLKSTVTQWNGNNIKIKIHGAGYTLKLEKDK